MTNHDDFDMFAAEDEEEPTLLNKSVPSNSESAAATHVEDLADVDGYLRAPAGTSLGSYRVQGELGKGVFSTVFLVRKQQSELAAKVLRANNVMYKAGQKELAILKSISTHPHVVSLVESFELEASNSKFPHLVLVFERMGLNLRETLDKFGRNVGISLDGVKLFARQLFSCFSHLRNLGIVHADLKPDNILVSSDFRRCAVADFGSAFYLTDPEASLPTPYLVSRYYRSPEIILGLQYGCESDIWSLGVTLFELFAGSILFPGETNNDMLALFQKRIGRFPNGMIKRHIACYETKLEKEAHFEGKELKFKYHETDLVTQSTIRRLVKFPLHPSIKDSIRGLVFERADSDTPESHLLSFSEMIEHCLTLDPHQRLDPRKADANLVFFHVVGEKSGTKKLKTES